MSADPIHARADAIEAHRLPAWQLELVLMDAIGMLEELPEGGEVPEYLAELVARALSDTEEKRDALAGAVIRKRKDIQALIERELDVRLKIDRAENALARLNDYILRLLDMTGKKQLNGVQYKIAWQKNPDKVELDETFWDHSPKADWVRQYPARFEPDKTAIKEAIRSGEVVPGARLVDGSRRIVVK